MREGEWVNLIYVPWLLFITDNRRNLCVYFIHWPVSVSIFSIYIYIYSDIYIL